MNLSSIDLNLLTAFDALMQHRQVTKAGQSVGLSQPAMSNALSRLRKLFDDQLLVRSSYGMEPTPRALELHEPIREALQQLEITISDGGGFDPATAQRSFTIAMAEDAAFLLLPHIKSRLASEAPGISVAVMSTAYVPGVDLVESGEAELSAALLPIDLSPHLRSRFLFEERLVCVLRKDHPALDGTFSLEDYLAYPHISLQPNATSVSRIDIRLNEMDRRRRVAVSVPHMLVIPFLLPGTELIATVASRIAEHFAPIAGLEVRRLPVDVAPHEAHLAWHYRFDQDPGHTWMRNLISDIAATL